MRTRAVGVPVLLAILLSSLLTLGLPLRSSAQLEKDNDSDAYDQETCNGVSEDEMEATKDGAVENPFGPIDLPGSSSRNGGNDPDAFSPFPNGSFQLPFELDFGGQQGGGGGGGGGGQAFSFVPTYTSDEDKRVNASFYPEPQVSLQLADPTAVQGEEVTATVQYDSFADQSVPGQNFYTVAFVDGVFLNGHMAGGSAEALQELSVGGGGARGDCSTVSRKTQSDSDGDGMDDDWEIRYGLNPNDPGDAGQDPDKDGYLANNFINLDGEAVQPAPPIAGAELGDGSFSNYEEYVLDTDPRNPDTDGDGTPDEADAVGLGQSVIKFPATKTLGEPAYNLHVIVVGRTQKKNEDGDTLIKIDSATRQVQTGTRENLQVQLQLLSAAAPGQTLVVTSEPTGTDQRDLLNTYRWSVAGQLNTQSSGQGRRTLEYPIDRGVAVGTKLPITLELINSKTGQLAKGALDVVVGDTVLLNYDPLTVEQNGTAQIQALLTAEQPRDDFLFNWTVNDQLVPTASRVGADTFDLPIAGRGGQEQTVSVTVYRTSDSALIGQSMTTLTVLEPSVQLVLTPEQPRSGDHPVLEITAQHFGSNTLQYSATVDGKKLETTGPLVSLPAVTQGEHHLAVTVRSTETPASVANAELVFNVTGAVVISARSRTPNVQASLVSTPVLGAASAIAVGVIMLVLVYSNRTKAHPA